MDSASRRQRQVGLYRITYDYNPKTKDVTRHVALISAGGNWANDPGAANVMVEMAKKQAAAEAAAVRASAKRAGAELETAFAQPNPRRADSQTVAPITLPPR